MWNATFMHAVFRRGPVDEPISFEALAGRQASTLERWFGHPFSYPANLLFAFRNGRSPSDYDLLWVNRFLGDIAQPYGRVDVGAADALWVGDGWYGAERKGNDTFRWAKARASLELTLDHAAPLRVTVRCLPFTWPGAPVPDAVGRGQRPIVRPCTACRGLAGCGLRRAGERVAQRGQCGRARVGTREAAR